MTEESEILKILREAYDFTFAEVLRDRCERDFMFEVLSNGEIYYGNLPLDSDSTRITIIIRPTWYHKPLVSALKAEHVITIINTHDDDGYFEVFRNLNAKWDDVIFKCLDYVNTKSIKDVLES